MTREEKQSLKIRLGKRFSCDERRVMEIIIEEIDKTPTKGERPHGEWKPYNRTGIRFQCSVCNGRYTNAYHFCPHCGASMKGDD